MTKEQLSNKYAIEHYPYTENMRFQCRQHYESGWEDALENLWIKVEDELPEEKEKVLVLYKHEGKILIGTDTYLGYNFYKMYGIINGWSFGGNRIIAWMPIPSFDKILEDNKDVLKRLKDK